MGYIGRKGATSPLNSGDIPGIIGKEPFGKSGVIGAFTSKGIDDNADALSITIDSDENVAIGKTPADFHSDFRTLEVGSGNTGTIAIAGKTTDSHAIIYRNAYYDATNSRDEFLANGRASCIVFGGTSPDRAFEVRTSSASGTADNAITWVNALTVSADDGRVGINGDPGGNQLQVISTKTTGIDCWVDHQGGSGTCHDVRNAGSGDFFAGRNQWSNYAIIIRADGDLENDNNSYGAYSDERLKKNIEDATPKLDELNQLRVVNFNWKHSDVSTGGNNTKQLGFIGQEVKEIFPGIVPEKDTRDIVGEEEYNNYTVEEKALFKQDDDGEWCRVLDDGTIKGNKDGLTMKYSVLVPMLVKGLQELSTKNDALEAENTALKTRMDALEARVTALEG